MGGTRFLEPWLTTGCFAHLESMLASASTKFALRYVWSMGIWDDWLIDLCTEESVVNWSDYLRGSFLFFSLLRACAVPCTCTPMLGYGTSRMWIIRMYQSWNTHILLVWIGWRSFQCTIPLVLCSVPLSELSGTYRYCRHITVQLTPRVMHIVMYTVHVRSVVDTPLDAATVHTDLY